MFNIKLLIETCHIFNIKLLIESCHIFNIKLLIESCHIFNIKLLIESCHMFSAFFVASLSLVVYRGCNTRNTRKKREVKLELSNLCSICIYMLLQWNLFLENSILIIQLLPIILVIYCLYIHNSASATTHTYFCPIVSTNI